MALLTLSEINLSFGSAPIFDNLSLQVEEGDRLALLGRNGVGKSTLLSLISGAIVPDSGTFFKNQSLKISFLQQDIPLDENGKLFDIVASGMGELYRLVTQYHYLAHHPALVSDEKVMKQFEELQHQMDSADAWSLHNLVESTLKRLSLNPDDDFQSLSGGMKRRALLAKALASSPDILLLDEPTNHLDIDSIIWLEEFLLKEVKSFIFVTHDRAFAKKVANKVSELDRGRLYTFSCSYDQFVERRESLLEAEIKRMALFDKKLAEEEAWIRKGIKARRTRNEGRVRALKAMREEYRKRRERIGKAAMSIQESDRSGEIVAELKDVSFSYNNLTPIFSNVSLTIIRGGKVAVIGSNGSGKTTLLKLILGELNPVNGSVKLGTRREIIYFDQLRQELNPNATVIENVGEGNDTITINGRQRHIIGYLQDFLFTPERARSPVYILSGGEKNRLLLAKLFTKPSNIIVMDEPTNDLDAETLELLEELLVEYSGTLIIVSHDREFVNNVATSTIYIDKDRIVTEFPGGYDDTLKQIGGASIKEIEKIVEKPLLKRDAKEKPRKLSFKEERELENIPDEIYQFEDEERQLHEKIADPAFYKDSGSEVASVNARIAELGGILENLYKRWDELESIREGKVK